MAKTVNSAFSEFNKDSVNLDTSRTSKAISSRDWLYEQLNKLDLKDELGFPLKYSEKHIKFGSFARKTKIRELDDVDIMFCFTSDGATYSKDADVYTIYTVNAGDRLKELSDNDILNSRKIVNKVKSLLLQIPNYSSAEIHRKGEAATLNLASYEWVFDIVPCFYTDTQMYLIPDGEGNWKATDPRVDQDIVTTTNKDYDGRALQLIRTLKYWNRHHSSHTISSYLFEQFVLKFIKSKLELNQFIDFDIRDFFLYLSAHVYNSVFDPKGIQGDLNVLSFPEKLAISSKSTIVAGL